LDETTYEEVEFELVEDKSKKYFLYANPGDFSINKVNKAQFYYYDNEESL